MLYFQHVCVIQIIILKLLKLFFGFSMFWIFIWTPCFNFYNLYHIPSKNIVNDNVDFPWFYHSKLTLSLEKSTHQILTLISLFVVQFLVLCAISYSPCLLPGSYFWASSFTSFKLFEFVPFVPFTYVVHVLAPSFPF